MSSFEGIPITNGQLLLTSADGIAAYGATQPVPVRDTDGRDGWLYTGKTGTQELVVNFYKEGYIPTQLGHILDAFFVATINNNDSYNDLPYLAVYTKTQGDGNDYSPGNYRSRRTYKARTNAPISVGEALQFCISRDPKIKYPFGKIHLESQTLQGPGAEDEDILYIRIETDGTSSNNTEILLKYAGWENPNLIQSPHIAFTAYDAEEQLLTTIATECGNIDNTLINGQIFTRPRASYFSSPFTLNNGQSHGLILDVNGRLRVNNKPETQSFSNTHSLSVPGNGSVSTTAIDLGELSANYKIQLVGTTNVNNIDVKVQVSEDNVSFYNYGHPMISVTGGEIYAQFDLAFRYYKLEVTDNSGSPATVTLIEVGKTF